MVFNWFIYMWWRINATFKTLKLSIPLNKVFRLSYIINAFNAIVGFGGFIGAGFRTFIYKNYTSDRKRLLHAISIILVSMLTGLSFLSILVVLHIFDASHILDKVRFVKWVLYVVALFLPIFIVYTVVKPVTEHNKLVGIYCTLVSSIEWIAAVGMDY